MLTLGFQADPPNLVANPTMRTFLFGIVSARIGS